MSTEPTKVPILANASDKSDILTNSDSGSFTVNNGFGTRLEQDLFPSRADFNGLFNLLSKPAHWFGLGGFFVWDSAIASSGGYPIRAIVKKSDNSGYWSNTVDNNTSNPDTGGAGWVDFSPVAEGIYAPAGHNHNGVYALVNHNHDGIYALVNHNHDGIYQPVGNYATQQWVNDGFQPKNGGLGAGQQWYDNNTLNRLNNTEYTNNTDKPIQVIVGADDTGGTATITVTVGGVVILDMTYDRGGSAGIATPSFIVPAGSTYKVNCSNLTSWSELR